MARTEIRVTTDPQGQRAPEETQAPEEQPGTQEHQLTYLT